MCYDQPIIIILGNLLFIRNGEWGEKHNNAMKDIVWQCSIPGKLKPRSSEEQKDAGCVNKWSIISLPEKELSNRSKNNHHLNIETTLKCDNECHNQFVVFTGLWWHTPTYLVFCTQATLLLLLILVFWKKHLNLTITFLLIT